MQKERDNKTNNEIPEGSKQGKVKNLDSSDQTRKSRFPRGIFTGLISPKNKEKDQEVVGGSSAAAMISGTNSSFPMAMICTPSQIFSE